MRASPRSSAPALAIDMGWDYLGVSDIPSISFRMVAVFGDSSVRFRYSPPGCLPPVLIRPEWFSAHPAA
jgi:hypothetical protein